MVAHLKALAPELSAVHRFGALLRRLRIEAGYSQPALAAKLYTSKSTLSRAETGVRPLPRDLAEACEALLDAGGSLISAWRGAGSTYARKAQGERTRRGKASGHCVWSLCSLALRSRLAETARPGRGVPMPSNLQAASNPGLTTAGCLVRAHRDRANAAGGMEPERYQLPHVVEAMPHRPPAGASPRVPARKRPEPRGRPPRVTAGGGLPPWIRARVHAAAVFAQSRADRG
jgi:transcriptional regulator with XRE-family HTH domain